MGKFWYFIALGNNRAYLDQAGTWRREQTSYVANLDGKQTETCARSMLLHTRPVSSDNANFKIP